MKTLIIVAHPNLKGSSVNKRFVEELKKFPEKYEIRKLYELYPDEKIAVAEEQKVIEQFDKIIFQFPIYWYNCPPLLKKWFDEVLIFGWAYGSKYGLERKKMALCLSANGNEEDYQSNGKHKFTLTQLTNSFDSSFNYIKADYKSFFAFYGAQSNATKERLDGSAIEYLNFIDKM